MERHGVNDKAAFEMRATTPSTRAESCAKAVLDGHQHMHDAPHVTQ